MSKQKAIEIIEQSKIKIANGGRVIFKAGEIIRECVQVDYVPLEVVVNTIDQIHEPQKVVVPKVALEYYEMLKGNSLSLSEWFDEMYVSETKDDFPKITLLQEWVHGNGFEKNREREMALATLFINGPKSVEVEKEQLYTVEIPDPNSRYNYRFLSKNDRGVFIDGSCDDCWKDYNRNQLTEVEIKKDFEWAWQFREEVD